MSRHNQFKQERIFHIIYTIYRYTNILNGHIYIGQTSTTLAQRAQSNGRNYYGCPRFYNAIKKYGWNSFTPDVLAYAFSQESANELEEYFINKFNSRDPLFGYNIAYGGHQGLSDEVRAVISQKAKERYRDKTKNPMYGKCHSDETKISMSKARLGEKNPMFGRKWTERQRRLCGNKGKKLNLSEDRRQQLKERASLTGKNTGLRPVRCIEDNITFESGVKAAEYYGVTKSTLNGHLKGRQHTCAGKHFEYID